MSRDLGREVQQAVEDLQEALKNMQAVQEKYMPADEWSAVDKHPHMCLDNDEKHQARLQTTPEKMNFMAITIERAQTWCRECEGFEKRCRNLLHSCKPTVRWEPVEHADGTRHFKVVAVQALVAGVDIPLTVDYTKLRFCSHIEKLTRFCFACGGPCKTQDVSVEDAGQAG